MQVEQKNGAKGAHTAEAADVLRSLNSDAERGLSGKEVARRLEEHGPNELDEGSGRGAWAILFDQFRSYMTAILIFAGVVSAFLGDREDAIAIAAIVVLNAALGFYQEYRAERSMAALKKLSSPTVKVRRDGHVREVSGRELVLGDVFLLEAGGMVPADARLLRTTDLGLQESALTGESEPVEKDPRTVGVEDLPLGERSSMVYSGTVVAAGRGEAVVTATGMGTELGRIAGMLGTVERDRTPLQRRLDGLGKILAVAALVIVAVVFALGLLRGEGPREMFLVAVSLAVAAVPEGLATVVTIALAVGSRRMLRQNALTRKLNAVETLGSVTTIASDKTGTLTENRMTVTILDVAGKRAELEEDEADLGEDPAFVLTLAGGALAGDAILEEGEDGPEALGDPTEGALVVAAARRSLRKPELEAALPRVDEAPFDSERKRMTTVHEVTRDAQELPGALALALGEAPRVAFTKGAVDSLLEVSTGVLVNGRIEALDKGWRERISAANEALASDGVRVLGVAFKDVGSNGTGAEELENDLVLVGLAGMIDPPRSEVEEAVETAREAGIRPIMITGDHPLTAQHIAGELGIAGDGSGDRVVTGRELDRMGAQELEGVVEEAPVYARVSPEHKIRIVEALQKDGHVVAMTGDGVNDAPALKRADIGVAMGITGTDVSKEAAEMVLRDDNFATIVAAVEQGRVIYDNIRKFIKYLLTSNSAEILVMLVGPFLGLPLPLLALQILWINLLTDGLPALALSAEPSEKGTMRRPPYPPDEGVFARGLGTHVVWVGALMAVVSLAVGVSYFEPRPEIWQTMVFTTLTFSQMVHVLAIRSDKGSFFSAPLSNMPLLAAVAGTFVLQILAVYWSFFQGFLETEALPLPDFALALGLSTIIFFAVEIEKLLKRLRDRKAATPTSGKRDLAPEEVEAEEQLRERRHRGEQGRSRP